MSQSVESSAIPTTPTLKIPVSEADHTFGPAQAPITLVEYGDYQCPHCREAFPIISQLKLQFPDTLRVVFRHFPLSTVHSLAQRAAEATEAAAAQGKFWELHEYFFQSELVLEGEVFSAILMARGIDAERVLRELAEERYKATVRENFRGGIKSGVNGTPAFFINGVRYHGKLTLDGFAAEFAAQEGFQAATHPPDKTKIGSHGSSHSHVCRLSGRCSLSASEDDGMFLDQLEQLDRTQISPAQLDQVFAIATKTTDPEIQSQAAVLLSELYPTLAPTDPNFAARVHTLLLRDLKQARRIFAHPTCSLLLVTHLRDDNLAHIPWQSTEEVVTAAECFYGFRGTGFSPEETHKRVRDLVKFAGNHFVQQNKWEEAFRLLSEIPLPSDSIDADLFRLRNALALYENRRVRKMRRVLGILMCCVILSVVTLSPYLFLHFENPYRAEHKMQILEFFDALYWSIITFATVGYGDVVPQTVIGRVLAVVNCILGVMTMGVLAGLLLSYVTPRKLS